MTASYLHDSLRDLAAAAHALAQGAREAKVVFMDEPGEHELILRHASDGSVEIEILWYDDWKSWNMDSGVGARKLFGSASVAEVREQVLSELRRLLQENGEAGYRAKWVLHDFPAAELRALEEAG